MISSAVLQIIAIITMAIDHVGYYLFSNGDAFRIIGRLAFPIFAFLLVEGFKHTHSRPRYFARLISTAVVAQIIFFLLTAAFGYEYTHNAIFTLCFAFISLLCAERGGYYLVAIPLLALSSSALDCDYGVFGVLMIVGFYYADKLFGKNLILLKLSQAIVLFAMMISCSQYYEWPLQLFSLFAAIPIALYSGKKGRRLPRGVGYVFYPAHLFVILLIKIILFVR